MLSVLFGAVIGRITSAARLQPQAVSPHVSSFAPLSRANILD
jgi:hypothetical protein